MNNNFSGVWISKEILNNKNLGWSEKLIFCIINSLSKTAQCFATNYYLSKILNVSNRQVSRIISDLKSKNYIKIITDKKLGKRLLVPIDKNVIPPLDKNVVPPIRNNTTNNMTIDGVNPRVDAIYPIVNNAPHPIDKNVVYIYNNKYNNIYNNNIYKRSSSNNIIEMKNLVAPKQSEKNNDLQKSYKLIKDYFAKSINDKLLKEKIFSILDNRLQCHKPVTIEYANLFLKNLDTYSNGEYSQKLKILDISIEKGYLSIYPIKCPHTPKLKVNNNYRETSYNIDKFESDYEMELQQIRAMCT